MLNCERAVLKTDKCFPFFKIAMKYDLHIRAGLWKKKKVLIFAKVIKNIYTEGFLSYRIK